MFVSPLRASTRKVAPPCDTCSIAPAICCAALLFTACYADGEPDSCERESELGQIRDAFSLKCTDKDFTAEADPNAEGFGQIPCRMATFVGYERDCKCEGDQFVRADPELTRVTANQAVETYQAEPPCGDEPPCVCEFLQSTGERLETCHRAGFQSAAPGWCWVEPDAGLGEPDAVSIVCGRALRVIGRPRVNGKTQLALFFGCQSSTED